MGSESTSSNTVQAGGKQRVLRQPPLLEEVTGQISGQTETPRLQTPNHGLPHSRSPSTQFVMLLRHCVGPHTHCGAHYLVGFTI